MPSVAHSTWRGPALDWTRRKKSGASRRISPPDDDDTNVSAETRQPDAPRALLALYDEALPAVYGYFARRCPDRGTAEDLTSETFLAAMDTARRHESPDITVPWLIGVARH